MTGLPPLLRSWLLVAIFLSGVKSVAGQDQPGRLDLLTGNGDQSSCQLRDIVHSHCSQSAPPPLNTTPVASLCTCNNVYFNIWSACSYSSGNNTLPVFSRWTDTCTNNSVDLSASGSMTTVKGGLGITVPVWAYMDIPGNTSFDLQRAVVLVHEAPKPWSVLQIVLPVAAAVIGAILTAVFLYARKRGNIQLAASLVDRLRPVRRVRTLDQDSLRDWEIERPTNPHLRQQAPAQNLVPLHDALTSTTTNRDTILGHPSIPSRATSYLNTADATQGSRSSEAVPGGRVYPFGPQFQQRSILAPIRSDSDPNSLASHVHSHSHSSSSSSSSSSGRGWHMPSNIRIPKPWKRRPRPIREVAPRKGFRVDERGAMESSSSFSATRPRSTLDSERDDPERLRGSFDVHRHEQGADEIDAEEEYLPEGGADADVDEGTFLITDEQRTSIGQMNGVRGMRAARESGVSSNMHAGSGTHASSSIDSHVRVVPPSASSGSPRSTIAPGVRTTSKYYPPPMVPPVPKQPAPSPPVVPLRMPLRKASNEPPVASTSNLPPPNRTMPSIQEQDKFYDANSADRTPSPAQLPKPKPQLQLQPVRPQALVLPLAPAPAPLPVPVPAPVPVSAPVMNSRRPSADSLRPLPSTSNALVGGGHQRSASHSATASASSVYEDESLNNSGHLRSHSDNQSGSSSRPPLPGPVPRTGTPRPLPSTSNGSSHNLNAPFSAPQYQLAASASVSSLAHQVYPSREDLSVYRTPSGGSAASPRMYANDRGLDVDDTASFYLTADPPRHVPPPRSLSPVSPDQHHPELLFPSSVRGAGYRGTPN